MTNSLSLKSDASIPIPSGAGSGKVLTSDANGFFSWQTPTTYSTTGSSWGQSINASFSYLSSTTVYYWFIVLGSGTSGVNVFTVTGYTPNPTVDAMLLTINAGAFNDTFACNTRTKTFNGVGSFDINVFRVDQ